MSPTPTPKNPARQTHVAGVVASLVLVLIGAFALLRSGADESPAVAVERFPTLVAVEPIPAGMSLGRIVEEADRRIELAPIEAPSRLPNAFTTLDQLEALLRLSDGDLVLVSPLAAGEQLRTEVFAAPADTVASPVEAEPDLHEVAIELDPERAGADLVVPGSTVAVVGSFVGELDEPAQTVVVAEGITVTRVQTSLLDPQANLETPSALEVGRVNTSATTVTLAVTTEQLETILWAKEFATIRLALQGPTAATTGSAVQDRWSVLGSDRPDGRLIGGAVISDDPPTPGESSSAAPQG